MKGYIGNIEKETLENENFRKVLYTAGESQLVVMSLKPGEDIGEEVHEDTDQFLRVEEGEGVAVLDGVESKIADNYAVVVPAGTKHNILNTSADRPLKLYTIYSPANHPDKTVHKTKKEAEEYEKSHH